MYKKMRSRLLSRITRSQQERKFVLEEVFWVPVNNCSSRRSGPTPGEAFSSSPDPSEASPQAVRKWTARTIGSV